MKNIGTIFLLLLLPFLATAQTNFAAGKIVWWGKNDFWKKYYSTHTNGLVENGDEFVSNAVAIVAGRGVGLALNNDGGVFAFGLNWPGVTDLPTNLTNIVSIAAAGDCYWAIMRNGTVARWGSLSGDEDSGNIVSKLSDVASIAFAGGGNVGASYLALKKDGTMLSFRMGDQDLRNSQVRVHGEILSNVVALASMEITPLILKADGTVISLGYQTPGAPLAKPIYIKINDTTLNIDYGGESRYLPYQYTSANPVLIDGQPLSNVISLASGGGHALALKKDGTVVSWQITNWNNNAYSPASIPIGISNVIAIAATENYNMVLKHDGTIVAWGNNIFGQTSVPAGLSNVVAIAAGSHFSLAITTGNIPSSVFIQPHGRLEEMEQEADLVFKGQVISDSVITNAAFPDWGKPHATEFNIISVFKGDIHTKVVTFLHITSGPMFGGWDGPRPPQKYVFDVGRSYLVFAMRSDKADWLYSPSTNNVAKPNEFRQIMRGEIPIYTLDNRPLNDLSEKEAHWLELNLLLNDSNPTNQLYAIDKLDSMSLTDNESDEWAHSDDFKRKRVLSVMFPLTTNRNERVAARAISCFPDQKKK